MAFFIVFGSASCSYRLANKDRPFVGGYRLVSVPIFKNRTQEPRIEVSFTNAMREELNRAKQVSVVDKDIAPITVEGVISDITYAREGSVTGTGTDTEGELPALPENAFLTTRYRIFVTTNIIVRRNADQSVLWQGSFRNERSYVAPQIGTESINSANALYNHSARLANIEILAKEMMEEAYQRMTENF